MNIYKICLGILITILLSYFEVYAQINPRPDRSKIPLFLIGKYKVEKIVVCPPIQIWEGQIISSLFQKKDTTDLGEYLKSRFSTDTLVDVNMNDTLIGFSKRNVFIGKQLFDFTDGRVMPYTVKFSQKSLGKMTYSIPIMIKNQSELLPSRFFFPQMRFILEREIQIVGDDHKSRFHTMLIIAYMTHRVDFENHAILIPIIPLKE